MGTFRPNIAFITLNVALIKFSSIMEEQKKTLNTVIEEMTHIIGFNQYSYKLFQDPGLNLMGIDNVAFKKTDASNNVEWYI
jgi:hypothetical protein